jgi:hypothetical protein
MCPLPVTVIDVLELDAGSIVVNLGHIVSSGQVLLQGPRTTITQFGIGFGPIVGLGWGFSAWDGRPTGACAPGQVLQIGGLRVSAPPEASITVDGVLQTPQAGFNAFEVQVTGATLVPAFETGLESRLTGSFLLDWFLFPVSVGGSGFPSSPADAASFLLHGQGVFDVALSQDALRFGPSPTVEAWTWTRAEFDLQPVLEPSTLLLFGTTMAGLGLARWTQRRQGSWAFNKSREQLHGCRRALPPDARAGVLVKSGRGELAACSTAFVPARGAHHASIRISIGRCARRADPSGSTPFMFTRESLAHRRLSAWPARGRRGSRAAPKWAIGAFCDGTSATASPTDLLGP